MIKTFLQYLKFYFDKIFTSKYKIEGKCNGCGACCKNIVFMIENDYVRKEEQFEELKKFDKKYLHFDIAGKNEKAFCFLNANHWTKITNAVIIFYVQYIAGHIPM